MSKNFNPRSHERSDSVSIQRKRHQRISIHAPTRGATEHQLRLCAYRKFQSTLPREERHELPQLGGVNSQFQSTLPREERRNTVAPLFEVFYFNPRSHERSDSMPFTFFTRCKYFNPRSHERSDFLPHRSVPFLPISIHAPTRGATASLALSMIHLQFQSTLPREERHSAPLSVLPSISDFNPRSHERSDKYLSV